MDYIGFKSWLHRYGGWTTCKDNVFCDVRIVGWNRSFVEQHELFINQFWFTAIFEARGYPHQSGTALIIKIKKFKVFTVLI